MPRADSAVRPRWYPVAAVGAWLLPGLGHVLLGERQRGLIIGVTIGLLWLGGLLVGGIGVVDRAAHPAWFIGQALAAPSVVSDYILRRQPRPDANTPDQGHNAYEPSFGRVQEQGILYTSLAGLLNLLAILDVAYREPGHRGLPRRPAQERETRAQP